MSDKAPRKFDINYYIGRKYNMLTITGLDHEDTS